MPSFEFLAILTAPHLIPVSLKNHAIGLVRYLLTRQRVKELLWEAVNEGVAAPTKLPPGFGSEPLAIYSEVVRNETAPIFITSRFRSGSTLLWRCFRETPGFTAFYEPLNERRWFDPRLRGAFVDQTHRDVADYWREYNSLNVAEVPWNDWWHERDFYLSPLVPAHQLRRYLQYLIRSAADRPILQFNRMDFRLHWLRSAFPEAFLIHLYRNPRDQWLSTFQKHAPVSKTASVLDFAGLDEFYLLRWSRDLQRWLPCFSEIEDMHPYELSYLLWVLSYDYARKLADASVSYENLVTNPTETLKLIAGAASCPGLQTTPFGSNVDASSVGRWRTYADESWFRDREQVVQGLLKRTLSLQLKALPVPSNHPTIKTEEYRK